MKLAFVVMVALGLTMAWQASVVAEYQEQTNNLIPKATADNSPLVRDSRS